MNLRALVITLTISVSSYAETIRVNGSTTVNPVVAEAAKILRKEKGMTIHVDTQGRSSRGITALRKGRIDLAISSRPLIDGDIKFSPIALPPLSMKK